MADTLVEAGAHTASDTIFAPWGPYWISTTVAVIVFIDSGNDLSYARTDDGGATWATTEIKADTAENLACWFDQETPGNTGTLVHMAWLSSAGGDNAFYRTLDIDDETLGTERTVDSTVTVDTTSSENNISITRTRSGNIIYAFRTQTEIECYTSTDLFATAGTNVADVYESASEDDRVLLYPADTGDGNDACAIYFDESVIDITIKMFDNSVPSWTEGGDISGAGNTFWSFHLHMDGAIRHSDGRLLVALHSKFDTSTDELRTREIQVTSITDPVIVNKTNIFTNQSESGYCAVFINQQNDDVYVVYEKGGTLNATADTVYHISTDDMANWGTEQAYSEETADDHRTVQAGRTVGNDGGFFQPVWYDDDQTEIRVNLVNDVAIAVAVAGDPFPSDRRMTDWEMVPILNY